MVGGSTDLRLATALMGVRRQQTPRGVASVHLMVIDDSTPHAEDGGDDLQPQLCQVSKLLLDVCVYTQQGQWQPHRLPDLNQDERFP